MDIELVTIGTELLLGLTVDTNGAEIARTLAAQGVRVTRRVSVADRADEIRDAVSDALRRTGAVITTGGLGPTRDDITKKVVADLFGAPLEFDDSVWANLLERFARLERKPAESNRSQAEVPRGAAVLRNRWGTAPGLWLEGSPGLVIMLPGVPLEMRRLLEHEVAPRLASRATGSVIRSLLVRTTGVPESSLAERMGEIEREIAPLTLAYLPGLEGVDLRLSAWGLAEDEADRRLRAAADLLHGRAGESVYGEGATDLAALVLGKARTRGLRLAVAESCTGGLLGGRLTEIPGSSEVFVGGVIAYSDTVKSELLEVPPALIAEHGAVSEPVARAMALGAARRFGVEAALSITGIAGPGGGSPAKPVGTVWIGCVLNDEAETRRILFAGSRPEIRARAVQAALFLLHRGLSGPARELSGKGPLH
ncbi:MAG TPA: competence/damage-inducible protein A [Gemmatimonadales bacterium]|nr:competence/damage-inducible protein A [Gemmatimonadales bacterium]